MADDEPVNCMVLGEILKERYELIYAEDGRQALDKISQYRDRLSAVILDMVMPEVDGMEVLRRIRADKETRFLPIVAMTSATELEVPLLEAGVNQFLGKPLERKEIVIARIDNVIKNSMYRMRE